MTGGGSKGNDAAQDSQRDQAVAYADPQQGYYQQQTAPSQNPCELEMKQFLDCAQRNSSDISMCTGFNELLKQCRTSYGMQM